ncbi:MAG: hypothetical protein KJ621_10880 [Proteobacteria bacterium]|nr:hypothetical protein [Pseudomonadota bacterium]
MIERVEILFIQGSVVKVTTEKEAGELPALPQKAPEEKEEVSEEKPTHIVSARVLWDFNKVQMQRPTEHLMDVSGIKYDGTHTLERLEPLELDESSPTYARSNLLSTRDALADMHQYGSLLTGVFHSHPGRGRSAVHPSQTDIRNQKKLEDAGYKCISAVFSRDGWVRFFTVNSPFRVVVKGKGVECVEENLYKLKKAGDV